MDRRQIITKVGLAVLPIVGGYFGKALLDAAVSIREVHDVGIVVLALGVLVAMTMIIVNPWARTAAPVNPLATTARPLDTPEGRKKFVDGLVVFHAQGVKLQTEGNYEWRDDQEMIDWMSREGQLLGEILGWMRAFDCSHSEIHDIGTLTPPRHVTFAAPAGAGLPVRASVARYQSFLTERLHRIKELMKKYDY